MTKKFQYQIIDLGIFNVPDKIEKTFGHLGQNGWELVGVFDKASNWLKGHERGFAIFKREVGDEVKANSRWARVVSPDQVGRSDGLSWLDPNSGW
ncbi:MAG: hypothetical protein RLZZ199_134 [Actinomycetota bacterium]|jgi:hypothetical protein